jgi:NADH dehydrogenase
MKILVIGATGFIGTRVVHTLRAEGRDVRALVRRPERAERLANLGAELVAGDVGDLESLRAAAEGCTHVVHLVAILRGSPDEFQRMMVDGFRNVLTAAKAAGIQRLVLVSAIGATEPSPSTVPYYAAKWQEEHDLAASGLEYVIFRPSFVFGVGEGALPMFIGQVRSLPVVPVIGDGSQRYQPIWVDDVAAYVARGLDLPEAANRTFEIGGPDIASWDELYLQIAATLGKRRRLVHIPFAVSRVGAALTQRLPGSPISVDQVTMLEGPDNVAADSAAVDTFGLPLVPLAEQIRRAS